VILYKSLTFKPPEFAHIPLILNPGGGKLSKRHSHATLDFLREKDYFPEAVINYVASLGWRAGITHQETDQTKLDTIYKLDDLAELFSFQKISSANAKLTDSKLIYLNSRLLRDSLAPLENPKATEEEKDAVRSEFTKQFCKYNPEHKDAIEDLSDRQIDLVINLVRDRIKLWEELAQYTYFVQRPDFSLEKSKKSQEKIMKDAEKSKELIKTIYELLSKAVPKKEFNTETIAKVCGEWIFQHKDKYNNEDFFHMLRFMLTGTHSGGPASQISEILGREETLQRIKIWLNKNTEAKASQQ
jgi:glutamyl/glutaminyl-tRNA synthetase